MKAGTALTAEEFSSRVLAWLRGGEKLASFAKCVKELMCVDGGHVLDGNVRVLFVKSGFISRGFFSSLDDYDRALNVLRALSVEESVKVEQRVYASPEFGAQRKLSNSSVLIPEKRDGREEI